MSDGHCNYCKLREGNSLSSCLSCIVVISIFKRQVKLPLVELYWVVNTSPLEEGDSWPVRAIAPVGPIDKFNEPAMKLVACCVGILVTIVPLIALGVS